jgi:acetyl-CoA/propionyl-CoA carboxylase carboxyl transferase subunit
VRKAYGGAFIAMNSRSLGATAVYAWPGAELGVMYPTGAAEILHRRLLASTAPARQPAVLARLARDYERATGGLDRAVALGQVDAVIDPAATRSCIASALRAGGNSDAKRSDGLMPSSRSMSSAQRWY